MLQIIVKYIGMIKISYRSCRTQRHGVRKRLAVCFSCLNSTYSQNSFAADAVLCISGGMRGGRQEPRWQDEYPDSTLY